jgi:hypothetical protein
LGSWFQFNNIGHIYDLNCPGFQKTLPWQLNRLPGSRAIFMSLLFDLESWSGVDNLATYRLLNKRRVISMISNGQSEKSHEGKTGTNCQGKPGAGRCKFQYR